MNQVLWLASWYPNQSDPFVGDFIKRQAEAVSEIQPVRLLYVGKLKPDPTRSKTNLQNHYPNLEEHILYYKQEKKDSVFSRIRSLFRYFRVHQKLIRALQQKNELPEIVHVHVAMKAGLIAWYLKWKYQIPFVLSEHWSGYYEQSSDSLFNKSFIEKYLTRRILKNASMILPVSEALGEQIRHYWAQVPVAKVPNTVNTKYFFPSSLKHDEPFRFIHISSLLPLKNPEGIIRGFAALAAKGMPVELVLVGPASEELRDLIMKTGQSSRIRCLGEISYEQVALEFRNASALILFSFYENLPCVMLEAFVSGIPVIATRVGGIGEEVNDSNGLLVDAGDEKALEQAMENLIQSYDGYDRAKISRQAVQQFSYRAVAEKITAVYRTIVTP